MIQINGKEWAALQSEDIQAVISQQDFDESFYFELKDDRVSPKKLMEEISAFANTFGGYIFLGVSDDRQIEGCTNWNEQRIHTTIHDAITPTPSFDIKKFTCDSKVVYVIKIDEGSEPPYITNSGKIYERLSSGSFPIRDSVRLSQIYDKREQLLARLEKKISIPPMPEAVGNIYGCIDLGFVLTLNDIQSAYDIFNKVDLQACAEKVRNQLSSANLVRVGNSLVFTPGVLNSDKGYLPAHVNSFLEIMHDGSAKMRLLLHSNQDNSSVNMIYALTFFELFKDVYSDIMGALFPDQMIYAKKYEALTLRRQFHPIWFYDDSILASRPDLQEENKRLLMKMRKYRSIMGIDMVVTDDRIPKTGLNTIDQRKLQAWGVENTREAVIDELFFSSYVTLGNTRAIKDD